MSEYAKAWVALVLAGVTAAQAIYVGNPWLTIAGAILTAAGVWRVPNTPSELPEP